MTVWLLSQEQARAKQYTLLPSPVPEGKASLGISKGGACSRCHAGPHLCSSTCDLAGRSRRRAISRKVVMR